MKKFFTVGAAILILAAGSMAVLAEEPQPVSPAMDTPEFLCLRQESCPCRQSALEVWESCLSRWKDSSDQTACPNQPQCDVTATRLRERQGLCGEQVSSANGDAAQEPNPKRTRASRRQRNTECSENQCPYR